MGKDVLKIIDPGLLTTVQDAGRAGYQQFGMPVSGAMDIFSLRCANLLVGNDRNEAALEFTFQGPKLEFLENAVIAIAGAEVTPYRDGIPVPLWRTLYIRKGSIISFGPPESGFRGYIAIKGGVDVPVLLGSKSTYIKGNFGGYRGRKLKRDDILRISRNAAQDFKQRYLPREAVPVYKREEEIRVILGPQQDRFTQAGIETFLSSTYEVTNQSDRMGYRLKGPAITHKDSADIITDGVPPGAVQVPGDGQPIVLMAERQPTGGYTKIAVVISADLPKMAQLMPGCRVTFKAVTLEEACRALQEQEKVIKSIKELEGETRVLRLKIAGRQYLVTVEELHL